MICWESELHGQLVIGGVIGIICYPCVIMSIIFYVTLRQPALISSGQGLVVVRRFRWRFNRFSPERYYYGTVYVVRGTLVALIPVAFAGDAMVQVIRGLATPPRVAVVCHAFGARKAADAEARRGCWPSPPSNSPSAAACRVLSGTSPPSPFRKNRSTLEI